MIKITKLLKIQIYLISILIFFITCTYDEQIRQNEKSTFIESKFFPKEETKYSQLNLMLSMYVQNGKVNYKGIKESNILEKAIIEIESIPLKNLKTKSELLSFWINAYNLYTIKAIVDNYPIKSINELHFFKNLYIGFVFNKTIWDTYKFQLDGKILTLNHIEHEILRKEFKDFRIHSAIVCASQSCPPLRSEAYSDQKINEQLNEQMKIFLSQEKKNFYDQEKDTIHLSKIFDWFEEDFTKELILLESLKSFYPETWKDKITSKTKVKYTNYDWNLNE
jgi:hypothetical protein